ncbi:MAG: hypothetical protein D3917_02590 [Candidatus Electrothrix sp. AX5]|nr:hypothetical protein [Candidatus Electrothrix sp. AX5]
MAVSQTKIGGRSDGGYSEGSQVRIQISRGKENTRLEFQIAVIEKRSVKNRFLWAAIYFDTANVSFVHWPQSLDSTKIPDTGEPREQFCITKATSSFR